MVIGKGGVPSAPVVGGDDGVVLSEDGADLIPGRLRLSVRLERVGTGMMCSS